MTQLFISFIAGVLTVLAPCILPLLPVILAGSVTDTANRRRPYIIVASLSVSVFAFTLLLKGSTALISVSPTFWSYVSAIILVFFGITLLFPELWARIVIKIPGHSRADKVVMQGPVKTHSLWSDILVGAALGPVFTTCSPTFFVILATILPQSLSMGIVNILAYIVGLAIVLLLVAILGQRIIDKLAWASNPYGWFRKILGIIFILLGISIALGFDKKVETAILDAGFFDVTKVEQSITDYLTTPVNNGSTSDNTVGTEVTTGDIGTKPEQDQTQTLVTKPAKKVSPRPGVPYTELTGIAGYINTPPLKLADLVGKKVILIDFIDYTCINCQRTFPYMRDWYSKYKDQGLEIVAIHTPEFSFEKEKANVEKGAAQFGLTFPIVLDNDYATWNAYKNRYWPHKYLIDIHGNIVYDHIGEGAYEETEKTIVELLNERKQVIGESGMVKEGVTLSPTIIQAQSPETYFGAARNENFGNGQSFTIGEGQLSIPTTLKDNYFYLGGDWRIDKEYAQNKSVDSQISFVFNASNMYLVAQTADGSTVSAKILIDGKPINTDKSGKDVSGATLNIKESRLYHLFKSSTAEKHRIDIIFSQPGAQVFTFTFG